MGPLSDHLALSAMWVGIVNDMSSFQLISKRFSPQFEATLNLNMNYNEFRLEVDYRAFVSTKMPKVSNL
jgi:hypothetical protein